jgi:hypothetical protein
MKFVPVIVTEMVESRGPEVGEMAVSVGAGGEAGAAGELLLQPEAGNATATARVALATRAANFDG